MDNPINLFYEYLNEFRKSLWGKITIGFFSIAFIGLPNWLPYILKNTKYELPIWINEININFAFQLIVLMFGFWFLSVYSKHFESKTFSDEIDKFLSSEKIKILHVVNQKDGEHLKNHALESHQLFIRKISHLYLTLILIYSVFLFDKNLPNELTSSAFYNTVSTIIKLFINSIAILILFRLYYILAYSYNTTKHYLKRRMDLLGFLVWSIFFLCGVLLVINLNHCFSKSLYNDLLNIAGLITGITFAVFFGKLDGALIGTPTTILWVGYTYSLIQATFFLFSVQIEKPLFFSLVIYLALLIKIILVIYFFWLVRKSRILIYSIFHWNIFIRTKQERQMLQEVLEKIELEIEEEHKS